MNEIIEKEAIKIENMIYEIKGKQVMLDSDLARLYQCMNGTKSINLVVRRHSDKSNINNTHGGIRYLPYVFTEQVVAMLSSVLKTEVASRVSVEIMRAFVTMRKYISSNLLEQKYINNMVFNLDERVSLLENTFFCFKTFSNELFFEGQIYDAYSLLLDIFNTSKKSLIIIDNYISKVLLDIVCKTKLQVTMYTKNIDNTLINKYQSQYNNLSIKINKLFYDRFIIIDNTILYHCGASFKDLGKKCFAINKIDNKE